MYKNMIYSNIHNLHIENMPISKYKKILIKLIKALVIITNTCYTVSCIFYIDLREKLYI